MENSYIKRVTLEGMHKRYDLDISFNESVTVLYGQNGSGKSTLLHIIANAANCDFIRFAFLDFTKIEIFFSNSSHLKLSQKETDEEIVIRVETETGSFFEFTKSEAREAAAKTDVENERYAAEKTPSDLHKRIKSFVIENNITEIETSYFPAFRTMLEAWSSQREATEVPSHLRQLSKKRAASFSRKLFGQFLPTINCPSPLEIEERLRDELRLAQMKIARYESSVFSNSFVKVFSALLVDGPQPELNAEDLLSEISDLTASSSNNWLEDFEEHGNTYLDLQKLVEKSFGLNGLASSASSALAVYRDALKDRKSFQKSAFKEIDKYLSVVNSFLDKKELAYNLSRNRRVPRIGLKFPDDTWSSIRVMSSGERQLLTMLYAVNKMSGNSAVLIDEPELSLHIDWQEELLAKMMEQLGNRQIIVCTHSPSIAADFDEHMKEVVPAFKDSTYQLLETLDDEAF